MRYYITRQRGMATLLVVFIISIILGVAIISATKVVLINRSAVNDDNLRKPLLALAEGALVIYQGRIYDHSKSNDEYNLIYTGGGDCADNVKITAETYTNNTIECTDTVITTVTTAQRIRYSDASGDIDLYYKGKIERVKYSNSYNGRDKTDHDPTYKITATAYTDSGRGLAVTVSKKVVVHRLVSPIPVPLMTAHGFFIGSGTTTTALSGSATFRPGQHSSRGYRPQNVKLNLIYPDPNNDRPVVSWVSNDATVQDMKNENAVIDVCYAAMAPDRLDVGVGDNVSTGDVARVVTKQNQYSCSSADKKKLYDHTISREQISGSSAIPTGRTDLTAFKEKYPLLGKQYGDGDVLSYVFGGITNAEDLSSNLSSTDLKFGNIDYAQRGINNTIKAPCRAANNSYYTYSQIGFYRKRDIYWIGGDKQQDCSLYGIIGSEIRPVLLIIKNTSLYLSNVIIYGVVVIIQDEQALVTAEAASTALTRPPYKDPLLFPYALIYGALVTDIQVPSDTYGSVYEARSTNEDKPSYKRRDKGFVVENFSTIPQNRKTLGIIYAPDIINTLRDKTIYTSTVPGSWTDNNEHLPH